jgi:hypothetical protein
MVRRPGNAAGVDLIALFVHGAVMPTAEQRFDRVVGPPSAQ